MEEQCTCIIAEDETIYRNQLILFSNRQGLIVLDTVSSGKQLIESTLRNFPDIIITDIGLNKLDGLEACQKLLHQGVNAQIIIISGSSHPSHYSMGFEIGTVDYINKPINYERFEKAIHRAKRKIYERNLLNTLQLTKINLIKVKHKYRDIDINEEHVVFVEKLDKRVFNIYLNDGTVITTSTNLEQIKNQCSNNVFYPHRSFLVNMLHIDIVLPDHMILGNFLIEYPNFNKEIPLTRRNYPTYTQLKLSVKKEK